MRDNEFIPVALAGRGSRTGEAPYGDLKAAKDDLCRIISAHVSDSEYALFGYNMGILLSHELVLRMKEMNSLIPEGRFGLKSICTKPHDRLVSIWLDKFQDDRIN